MTKRPERERRSNGARVPGADRAVAIRTVGIEPCHADENRAVGRGAGRELTADSFDTAAHSQATAEEACGKTADFLEKGVTESTRSDIVMTNSLS